MSDLNLGSLCAQVKPGILGDIPTTRSIPRKLDNGVPKRMLGNFIMEQSWETLQESDTSIGMFGRLAPMKFFHVKC